MNGKPYGEQRDRLARTHRLEIAFDGKLCGCDWCRIAELLDENDRLSEQLAVTRRT